MWRAKNKLFWLSLSICWLIAGISLYALMRPLYWMPWKAFLEQSPAWLHQQLPDGLWAAAFASFLIYISPVKPLYPSTLLWPLICAGAIESLQWANLWPGTGDIADLIGAVSGCLVVWTIKMLIPDEKKAAL